MVLLVHVVIIISQQDVDYSLLLGASPLDLASTPKLHLFVLLLGVALVIIILYLTFQGLLCGASNWKIPFSL